MYLQLRLNSLHRKKDMKTAHFVSVIFISDRVNFITQLFNTFHPNSLVSNYALNRVSNLYKFGNLTPYIMMYNLRTALQGLYIRQDSTYNYRPIRKALSLLLFFTNFWSHFEYLSKFTEDKQMNMWAFMFLIISEGVDLPI